MKKLIKFVACFGLQTAKLSANTACILWWHQPTLPESVKKLRTF